MKHAFIGVCGIGLLGAALAWAEPLKTDKPVNPLPDRLSEDDRLYMQFGFYHQNDGAGDHGGNPALDERETVYEAIIMVDKAIGERDRLNVRFLGDLVSSASVAKYNKPLFRALQSYPSGNKHGELGLGWQHKFDAFTAGIHGSFAYEASMFFSGGYGLDVSIPFNNDNTTVGIWLQGNTDHFQEKLFTGYNNGYDTRQTISGEIWVNQVLTPKTQVNLNYHHTEQYGFLATTYQSVFINGVEFAERAPDSRHRDAWTGRLKQAITDWNAFELGYRYYHDTWDINAHTVDLRLFQYLIPKRVMLQPSYRYYTQDAAFFYAMAFPTYFVQMTSDPDLGHFDGHDFGIGVTIFDAPFLPILKADLDVSYHYYMKSDDLNLWWITVGYAAKF